MELVVCMISLDHSPEDDNVGKIMETNTEERRGIRRVEGEVNKLYRCWCCDNNQGCINTDH